MDSNAQFLQVAPMCLLITLAINAVLIAIYCFRHRKYKVDNRFLFNLEVVLIGANTAIFFVTMCILFFGPTTVTQRSVTLEPEIITDVNIVEKENVIDVPSIMLPLNPEGKQAVVIDTTSLKMKSFMDGFYGDNVYFFNNRQDSNFLFGTDGLQNYSGLDITKIEYKDSNSTTTLQLDEMGFETIWLFSDLSNVVLTPTKCKVVLYVPRQLTTVETEAIKSNGNITIITIDQIS